MDYQNLQRLINSFFVNQIIVLVVFAAGIITLTLKPEKSKVKN